MEAHSHTSRQQYLSCPRSWYLKRMLRFEKETDPAGLRMGKAMAEAVEAGGKGATLPASQALAEAKVVEMYRDAIKTAPTAYHAEKLKLEEIQLRVLAPAYIARYSQRLIRQYAGMAGYALTTHEVPFDDPILGPGRLDAVVRVGGGPKGTTTVGVEDKLLTAGFWRAAEEKQLRINAQVTAYFAAMRAAGTPLDVLHYRVTFKPTIKPNSVKKETLADYAKRLTDRVNEEEGYAFKEYQLYRTDAELDAFIARTEHVNRMIARSKRDVKRYGDAAFPANFGSACTQFGECEFLELCIHGPSAVGYRIKPKRTKLSKRQEIVLRAVDVAFVPPTAAEVAKHVALEVSQVRTAADALVKLGFLQKERSRHVRYFLTGAGQDWLA